MKNRKVSKSDQLFQIKQSHYFLFFLIFVSLVACYNLFQPYIHPIVLAVILATILHPIHQTIEAWSGKQKNLAALISCTLLTLVVVLPLLFMTIALVQQGIQAFNAIANWTATGKYRGLLDFPTSFELTAESIASLQKEEMPAEIVEKLTPLVDQAIIGEDEFLAAVKLSIGEEQTAQYQKLFLKHADSPTIFKFTEKSFEALKKEELPANMLANLQPLTDQAIAGEDEFLAAVKARIGEAQTIQHQKLFLKHADPSWVSKIITIVKAYLPNIQKLFPDVNLQSIQLDKILLQGSATLGRGLLSQGGSLFGNVSALVGKFFLMIFVFFFLIRDQETFFKTVLHLIPLSASDEEQIITKIKDVARSALLGTFVTAAAQGAAGGVAFWIAGLPALFWGTAMAFLSLIPVIGAGLVWVPAAIYLFISGRWGYGIFMVLWCSLIVGMIDNFLRPFFMKGAARMSTLLIFLSILGGISYFGLIGLLYGPLIVGITLVLLYLYSLEFKPFLDHQDRS